MASFLLLAFFILPLSLHPALTFGDKQLDTLKECKTLFQPENEEMVKELKRAVAVALTKLPEKGWEIVQPKEYLKIVEDYDAAEKIVTVEGKATKGQQYELVTEKLKQMKQKKIDFFNEYRNFMEALKKVIFCPRKSLILFRRACISAKQKFNLIMEAKQICSEVNINGSTGNKTTICDKLNQPIGKFVTEAKETADQRRRKEARALGKSPKHEPEFRAIQEE